MNYKLTTGEPRWKIDALKFDQLNRWQLCVAEEEVWKRLKFFPSAEAAIDAIASGATGVPVWDAVNHNPADFALEKWSAERW